MTTTLGEPVDAAPPAALSSIERTSVVTRLRERRTAILDRWYANQFDDARLQRWNIAGVEQMDRGQTMASFLAPLLNLAIEYLSTGESRYRAVYLDERLRYAPHQLSQERRCEFFRELLPADEEAIGTAASDSPSIRSAVIEELTSLHAPLVTPAAGQVIRMLALGDCVMGDVRVFLHDASLAAGFHTDMRCLYFSGMIGTELSTKQVRDYLAANKIDVISASFLTYQGIAPYNLLLREADSLPADEVERRADAIVGHMRRFLADLREVTDAPFLLHNTSGLPLTRLRTHIPAIPALSGGRRRVVAALNERIAELAQHTTNCLLIDEWSVVEAEGHRQLMTRVIPRRIAGAASYHTLRLGESLSCEYVDHLRSFEAMRRAKVVLVDFDNTLWDGVMADGPVTQHLDRQETLRQLREAGIVLVALSKNDPANIRWNEMRLTPDDFVLQKISWNPKVQSIRESAEQLDLGLDAFVLVDDNPAERELVRTQLPKVRLLDATDAGAWKTLERTLEFPNTKHTEEARRRTEMYREQALRKEAMTAHVDLPAMMRSLQLEARFGRATSRDLDRLTELVQRTNQFNTTTIRYTRQQLQQLMQSPTDHVFVSDLRDKFGNLGLVCVAVVGTRDGEATFDSFVMSCRAMGFGLEHVTVRLALDALSEIDRVSARFVPTDRNTPSAALWKECGFSETSSGVWTLADAAKGPQLPEWFEIAER
jgi:FkbH-like protein